MFICTTMERNSTISDSSGSKPTERSLPAGSIPDPWPLRTDFHWVPGSDLEPLMALHDYYTAFLAQLGDYTSSTLNTLRTISVLFVRTSVD